MSCDQCDYKGSSHGLYRHRKSKHEGVKYPCAECNYIATTSSHLKRHIAGQHEGLRYPCDQCSYSAAQVVNLKRHIESKHQGIRYPCGYCDFSSARQSDLRLHIENVHKGIRYPCDQCDFSATRPSFLNAHKKKKHGPEVEDHITNFAAKAFRTNLEIVNKRFREYQETNENYSYSNESVSCETEEQENLVDNVENHGLAAVMTSDNSKLELKADDDANDFLESHNLDLEFTKVEDCGVKFETASDILELEIKSEDIEGKHTVDPHILEVECKVEPWQVEDENTINGSLITDNEFKIEPETVDFGKPKILPLYNRIPYVYLEGLLYSHFNKL